MDTVGAPAEIAAFLEGLKLKSYARAIERATSRLDGVDVLSAAVAIPGLTRLVILASRSAIIAVGDLEKHDVEIAYTDIRSVRKGFLETLRLTLADGREVRFSSIQPAGRTAELVRLIEECLGHDSDRLDSPAREQIDSHPPAELVEPPSSTQSTNHVEDREAATPPSIADQFVQLSQDVLQALAAYRTALDEQVRRDRDVQAAQALLDRPAGSAFDRRMKQFSEATDAEHEAWQKAAEARDAWTQPMFALDLLLCANDEEDAEAITANTLWASLSAGTHSIAVSKYEPDDDVWGSDQLASYLMAARAIRFEEAQAEAQRAARVGGVKIVEDVSLGSALLLKEHLEALGCEVKIEGATTTLATSSRKPIPERVRHEVWRRDNGSCVDCGSRESLEFDHIIPVSRGGSNTARNLELRCETCNRHKGATI